MGRALVVIEQPPILPDDWDFDASVSRVRPMVYKWKSLTGEIIDELRIARNALSTGGRSRQGERTWDDYCQAIGVPRNTANLWLRSGENSPLFTSASSEWLTPTDIIDRAVTVLGGIDLDPCSDNHGSPNVIATHHYTQEDDGLSQRWFGRVYMNPPYGRVIGDWVSKLVDEHGTGRVTEAIALVPARTDTEWFSQFRDGAVCFIRRRLKFSNHENSAPFPSAAIYLGNRLEGFCTMFSDVGDVWVRLK